jgi:predicted amidophosphoribosyltransferase
MTEDELLFTTWDLKENNIKTCLDCGCDMAKYKKRYNARYCPECAERRKKEISKRVAIIRSYKRKKRYIRYDDIKKIGYGENIINIKEFIRAEAQQGGLL